MRLKGTGIYPDIAFGKITVYHYETLESLREKAVKQKLSIEDFEKVVEKAKKDLLKLEESLEGSENLAEIIEFQRMLLEDESFYGAIKEKISSGIHPAEAIYDVVRDVVEQFRKSKSVYMRQRAADIIDLGMRLLRDITGIGVKSVSKGAIIVTEELSPTDVVRFSKDVAGIATERGSALSHFAIIARELGIPTVVGVKGLLNFVSDGDIIILNGVTGDVILKPPEETLQKYEKIKESWKKKMKEILAKAKEKAITKDRVEVKIVANVANEDEVALANYNGAEGIGLFRTEFYFLYKESPPSEDEQYHVYKFAAAQMNPNWVYIRTLDIGSDKQLPYLELPKEPNPALGMRAVRIYNTILKDIIREQIRAILRASKDGRVGVMIPMVADVEEVKKVKELVKKLAKELKDEGHKLGEYRFGIMVETPAAAMLSDQLAKIVDFMSIGTNDLTQYTLAVDRAGRESPDFFDHVHPAVLRLVKIVSKNAERNGVELSVCGESASDIYAVPLLIGLGIRKLSMSPTLVPLIKYLVRQLSIKDLKELAEKALLLSEPSEVRKLVKEFYKQKGIDIPIF